MSDVSKAPVTRLRCALVEPHLKVKFTLMSPKLFFCESPLIFFSHFGSKSWSCVLWMFLSLKI